MVIEPETYFVDVSKEPFFYGLVYTKNSRLRPGKIIAVTGASSVKRIGYTPIIGSGRRFSC